MSIEVKVNEKIARSPKAVFDAFVDPEKMQHYFISGSSGKIASGARLTWEFDDVGSKVPVEIRDVVTDRKITFGWGACGAPSTVTIDLEPEGPGATRIKIREDSFPEDEQGIKRAMGQTAGWTYTLCCLKAYLQFGINLRTGLNKRITDVS